MKELQKSSRFTFVFRRIVEKERSTLGNDVAGSEEKGVINFFFVNYRFSFLTDHEHKHMHHEEF